MWHLIIVNKVWLSKLKYKISKTEASYDKLCRWPERTCFAEKYLSIISLQIHIIRISNDTQNFSCKYIWNYIHK